jgi:1-deoxy-D-xylulose-5-phosphate reductoisomerase
MGKKRLAILGATGSIGGSALQIAGNLPDFIELAAVSTGSNIKELAEIIRRFGVRLAAAADERAAAELKRMAGRECRVLGGPEAAAQLVRESEADVVLVGISGIAGLAPSIETVRAGKRLALANKESLVAAGEMLLAEAARSGAEIIPVDSEHSAVFQALRAGKADEVERIVLTASGGPFRNTPAAELEHVRAESALKHPTWRMGPKITIDSATLMNKALEIIEAHVFFNLPPERIDVVVHPQSIVHSIVHFRDGSAVAQMGLPDMRVPIQYALTFPERKPIEGLSLDLASIGTLTFEKPDRSRFGALDLAYEVCRRGGTSGACFNAANEEAVKLYIGGKIGFNDVTRAVAAVLEKHKTNPADRLEAVYEADGWARSEVKAWYETS